jgi:hypothetical protein
VYTYPWTPHVVNVNATETTEYLGGIYDIKTNGKAALNSISDTARLHCHAIQFSNISATSKIIVAMTSTLKKVQYKAALSTLNLDELHDVDKIFSRTHRAATRNMVGFPTELIYTAKKFGGLGIHRFSDEVQIDKLSKIQTALRSSSIYMKATQGMLYRAARKGGHHALPGYAVIITPTVSKLKRKQTQVDDEETEDQQQADMEDVIQTHMDMPIDDHERSQAIHLMSES